MFRACAIAALLAGPAAGQGTGALPLGRSDLAPPEAGRLLVIDRQRVLEESMLGRARLGELDAATEALVAENRQIEDRLREEERRLTERRAEMEPAAFRAEAEAFDARVQEIRVEQDAKRRELLVRRDEIVPRFWDEVLTVVAGILQERGAVVVLDRDGVFLSSDAADITDEVIARIDASTGPGLAPDPPEPPSTPRPEPVEPSPAPDALVITPPDADPEVEEPG